MAYDISGMAAYSKSDGVVLIRDLILAGQSFNQKGIAKQPGIKSTDKLVDFSVGETNLQETLGDPGALNYSGGSVLTDIDISVVEIAIKERYKTGTLNTKITQMQQDSGSDPSQQLPYNDVLVGLKSKQLGKMNDALLWSGVVSGNTNGSTNIFDGWLTLILAGSSVDGGTAADLESATAIATVEAYHNLSITNFPEWVDESFIWMSPKNFSTYYRAVYGLNGVIDNQTLSNTMPTSFIMPGTNTLVQSNQGLYGKPNLVETRGGNLVIGTDLESEDESLSLEYLNEALIWRLLAIYKLGAKVARVDEVVVTK